MLMLSARAWAKPATPSGLIVASAPPASMMSASSSLIIRAASPIEWAPVEQAVTTAWLGPISPYLIDTWPLVRLISRPWTKCGRHPARALFGKHQRFALDPRQAADARADRDAGALALCLAHVGQAGILERLAGGIDRVDDERIDLALDLVVDALVGVEAVFDGPWASPRRRSWHFWSLASKRVIGPIAALAGNEVAPRRLDVAAKRGHQAQTSHYDTAHHLHSA